jgi:hypothetical protein
MQSFNIYYYLNEVTVQLNIDPTVIQRNRVMYARTIKMYKGVDNIVRFTFKNSDQKPVNVNGWDVTFNMISDEEGAVLFSTPVTAVDANVGVVTATIKELDLIDLYSEHYNYSLSVTNQVTGQEQVVYTDDNYTARGEVQLLSGHYPTFKPSINVQLPTNSNTSTITSGITSDTPTRQLSAHHTAQMYFNTFSGNVVVQATLDANPQLGNSSQVTWATVSTLQYTNQTVPDYVNFDGVYSAVRFEVIPTAGNVSAILYRA